MQTLTGMMSGRPDCASCCARLLLLRPSSATSCGTPELCSLQDVAHEIINQGQFGDKANDVIRTHVEGILTILQQLCLDVRWLASSVLAFVAYFCSAVVAICFSVCAVRSLLRQYSCCLSLSEVSAGLEWKA